MVTANFSVTLNPTTPNPGYVNGTIFTFTDLTTSSNSIVHRTWDLGDGSFVYDVTELTKVYNYPGVYAISLTATDLIGSISTFTNSVSVDYYLRDSVEFTSLPSNYANPGSFPKTSFRVKINTAQIDQPIFLNLFAANSQSTPYQFVPEHWRFLTPTWRFTDNEFNFVTSLSVNTYPVYFNNSVVGLSGETEFYYVDGSSTGNPESNCPIVITATMETSGFSYPKDSNVYPYPGYANNKNTTAATTWLVNDLRPNFLKITENYLTDIFPQKWEGVKIPFLITCHNKRNDVVSDILFSYPDTNLNGSISSINVTLSNTQNFIVDESPLYFKATDENNSKTGGFLFTTLTPTSTINTTVIQASTVAFYTPDTTTDFPFPAGEGANVNVWISNPEQDSINKILLGYYSDTCKVINSYKDRDGLYEGHVTQINVPKIDSTATYNNSISSFSGIYGMAVDPINYDLIATDTELDRIYKFNTEGTLLSTFYLSALAIHPSASGNYTPTDISLDSNLNIYVCLYNAVSVLKFDINFNYLQTLSPTGINLYNTLSGNYLLKPFAVETDKTNNVWVTYANPLCSLLVKYNTTGSSIYQISLPVNSEPIDLAINKNNNVWICNSYSNTLSGGSLQLYSSTGTLISTVSGFTRPSNIAIDRGSNVWFTYGIENIGYYTTTGTLSTWVLSADSNTFVPVQLSAYPILQRKELGGIAVDVYNRVWTINPFNNKTFTFLASSTIANVKGISIIPSVSSFNEPFRAAQAIGDWTGNKWYQKFYSPNSVSAIPLTGTSTPFSILEFENPSQIFRINENFNTADYYKSLALPEILNQNTQFFDTFLGAVVGNSLLSSTEDLGQTVYERIANFVYNTGDIDSCNIDQLLSFAQETDTAFINYGLTLPADIKKYLDIASIPKTKLWGIQSPVPLSSESVGQQLNTQTALITAGTKIYILNKFSNEYSLFTVPLLSTQSTVPLSGQSVYPLSSMNGTGLVSPFLNSYLFFEYTPVYSNTFIENIIDWSNPNTTLNPNLSTSNNWYGETEGIEKAFNYLLTKYIIVK